MPDIFVAPPSSGKQEKPPSPTSGEPSELEKIKQERSGHSLAAFVPTPESWRFETQEKDEKIVLILRRHWLTNLGWISAGVSLTVLPIIGLIVYRLPLVPGRFKIMGLLIWYLLLGGFVFERFLNWFFNVFIITDERIVDFDFYGLIYKEISDAKTEDIQDVTYRVGGFLKNLFNFGDVFIQTAAQEARFEFFNVPHPGRVAKILRELITEEEVERLEGRVR